MKKSATNVRRKLSNVCGEPIIRKEHVVGDIKASKTVNLMSRNDDIGMTRSKEIGCRTTTKHERECSI